MADLPLTDFLLERTAEDEAIAQAVIDETYIRQWRVEEDGDGWAIEDAVDENACVTCNDSGGNELSASVARHMAHNDPARVLAECEAKRRIVELRHSWNLQADGAPEAFEPILRTQVVTADTVLRTLAAVYAGHPDYRQEWRP